LTRHCAGEDAPAAGGNLSKMARNKDCCASNLSFASSCAWCASLSILAILDRMSSKVSCKATKSNALIVIVSSYSSSSSSSSAVSGSTATSGYADGSGCATTSGCPTASTMSIGSGSFVALARCPHGMCE
jgi:hypothetical protein